MEWNSGCIELGRQLPGNLCCKPGKAEKLPAILRNCIEQILSTRSAASRAYAPKVVLHTMAGMRWLLSSLVSVPSGLVSGLE